MENPLKWSSTYTVTPPNRTSKKLYGDKICLPQSALEGILNAFSPSADTLGYTASFSGNRNRNRYPPVTALSALDDEGRDRRRELPYPLTFRIINRKSGRIVHAGILEFSAEENEVSLSPLLLQSLGIQDSDFENREEVSFESGTDHSHTTLIVHAVEIPKGTYVRLRPLEPGYDTEDWKALLEQYLRTNFTTLTVGETFSVRGAPDEVFQFLVDKVEPEGDAICIVDTDLEVDIEPLDEEQARESDRRRKEKLNKKALAKGGELRSGKQVSEEIPVGQYVDYELRDWNRSEVLEIELNAEDTADIDVFASPFSARQRNRPRLSEHVFSDCSSEFPKIIRVQPTNVELQDVEAIYISIHARPSEGGDTNEGFTWPFSLRASTPAKNDVHGQSNGLVSSQNADEEQCSNCHQWIPKRTLILHENFCLRNNISCPKCEKVFQKRSSEWQNHWHCPHDEMHGNDSYSKSKHDSIFHTEQTCKSCLYQARNIPDLAQHRTTVCPEKLILCQFCHLILPQKGDSDPDVLDPEVLLSGLTPHEFVDGTRTTECHLCSRIIRLRDMTTHLRHHDLDRLSRPPPQICNNPNCCTPLEDPTRGGRATSNGLGLCSVCFGPLYVDVYDPEGKALRRRIERRYLSQMLTGCGNSWCRNEYCKTGRTTLGIGSVSSKDALTLARPLVSAVAISCSAQQVENTAPLYFCTDENNQTRRKLAELLAAEAGYELGWCIAAVQDGAGDMDKAKDWLKNWAPKKGEKFGDTK